MKTLVKLSTFLAKFNIFSSCNAVHFNKLKAIFLYNRLKEYYFDLRLQDAASVHELQTETVTANMLYNHNCYGIEIECVYAVVTIYINRAGHHVSASCIGYEYPNTAYKTIIKLINELEDTIKGDNHG